MIKRLIERPVAVTMTLIAVLVLGFVSIGMLPVSLMPDIQIPQITVRVVDDLSLIHISEPTRRS